MHTNLQQAHTRSIAIDAGPETVVAFVSDPDNLPRWAPAFAPAITRRDGQLLVRRHDGGEFAIVVEVDRRGGTVDFVAAEDHSRGAFTRVLPNGDGSEYALTLFFDPATQPGAVARQLAVVDDELAAVRDACARG